MASNQDDIASKLLRSSDARIAEAAKRVFSSGLPATAVLAAFSPAPSSAAAEAVAESPPAQSPENQQSQRNRSRVDRAVEGGGERIACNVGAGAVAVESAVVDDHILDERGDNGEQPPSTDRLKRSRERNRMHARKTRQRKKEHMQQLHYRVEELRGEHLRLKQAINDKTTASILVGLFQLGDGDGSESNGAGVTGDPRVDLLLKRSAEDIPNAANIPDLPALILPGKRKSANREESLSIAPEEDGIDYALLGKDRSTCSPAELDQIRRERNRMHAKRTRDRKRILMDEMEGMMTQLKDENSLLRGHLTKLNSNQPPAASGSDALPPAVSPTLGPVTAPSSLAAAAPKEGNDGQHTARGDFLNQIEGLLAAAGSFQKERLECDMTAISCAESDATTSTNRSDLNSFCGEEDGGRTRCPLSGARPSEGQQGMAASLSTPVPKSITTTSLSLG